LKKVREIVYRVFYRCQEVEGGDYLCTLSKTILAESEREAEAFLREKLGSKGVILYSKEWQPDYIIGL